MKTCHLFCLVSLKPVGDNSSANFRSNSEHRDQFLIGKCLSISWRHSSRPGAVRNQILSSPSGQRTKAFIFVLDVSNFYLFQISTRNQTFQVSGKVFFRKKLSVLFPSPSFFFSPIRRKFVCFNLLSKLTTRKVKFLFVFRFNYS